MDPVIARKLDDKDTYRVIHDKLLKIANDYIALSEKSTNFFAPDYDSAHDLFQCYSALDRKDLEALEGGHPKKYILPMTSTQITTMATFIAQALFGTSQPNKVEPGEPGDEVSAEIMNQLLRWNAERQSSYLVGYMWVVDCLLYNRGVMYESYEQIHKSKVEQVEVEDKTQDPDETGNYPRYKKFKRSKETIGGFNRVYIVSPYQFLCDPILPLYRLPEMRFVGHGMDIPWIELKRRSMLDKDDPEYVSERAVEALKDAKEAGSAIPSSASSTGATSMSRTAYQRGRTTSTIGSDSANKEDGGIIKCHVLSIKLVPKDNEINDDDEVQTWDILIGNRKEVLAANESILAHNEFPYSVGEGRPSPHYQYTPSWAMVIKPLQDYVDYLKNRRQEAQSNTVGNVFIIRPDKVNVDDFKDPNKEGKFITVLPEAGETDLNNIVKQVQVNDVTKDFVSDMMRFSSFAETASGANSEMQGNPDDASATAVAGAQQMSMGRLSSIARCLSTQALVPQTRRMVSNFQQFFDTKMYLRIKGSSFDLPPELIGQDKVEITHDTIQGEFDYVPHDGSLPTTDAKKVAAMTRIIESAGAFPFLFDPNVPGSFDLRKIFAATAKAAGVPIENFTIKSPAPGAPPVPGGPPQAPPPGAPQPGGAPQPPAPPASQGDPRDQDVGGGMTLPDVNLAPMTPAIRPANAP